MDTTFGIALRRLVFVAFGFAFATALFPCTAFAENGIQSVKSSWTEVLNIYEEPTYSYNWCVRVTITVEDGVVVGANCNSMKVGGGDMPVDEVKYYNPCHIIMESFIEEAVLSVDNPDAVDGIDTVSGATHTSAAIKKATKEALAIWAERAANAQSAIDAINAISTASDKEVAVKAARSAYKALSADLQTYVPAATYQLLADAEEELRIAALDAEAEPVRQAIAAIADAVDKESAIAEARGAYDALSAEAKMFVSADILKLLTDAEAELEAQKREAAAEADLANASVKLAATKYTYSGQAFKPAVTVVSKNGVTLVQSKDYTVAYSRNVNAGTATVVVNGINGHTGSNKAVFTIAPASQTIKAAKATYKVKFSKVKKAKQTVAVKFSANGGGKVTYASAKSGKVSIAKNGKVTVKKGAKKGTYTLKVKATAAANGNYAKTIQTVNLKVKVA